MNNPHEEHGFGAGEPLSGRRIPRGQTEPRQDEGADPVVDHPHLPRMDVSERAPRDIGGRQRLMDEHTPPQVAEQARGHMSAVPEELAPAQARAGGHPPQQPQPDAASTAEPGGYLRLQMRVEDGEVSLVGAARVAGPLSPPGPVHGGLAYEVTIGDQHIGAGDVPDPGVRRGLPPQDAPERGHSIVPAPSYEFTARVPTSRLSRVNLPDLHVAVYRMDSAQVVQPTADRPLRAELGRTAEEVARLRGIRTDQLPQEVRAGLERALR